MPKPTSTPAQCGGVGYSPRERGPRRRSRSRQGVEKESGMRRRRATWLVTGAAALLCARIRTDRSSRAAQPGNRGRERSHATRLRLCRLNPRTRLGGGRLRHRSGRREGSIALDVMRPAATGSGFKAPVIMDASPYYSTLGRGNEAESAQTGTATACSTAGRSSTTTTSCPAATPSSSSTWSARATRQAVPSRAAGRPPERRRRHRLAERSEEGLRQERQRGRRRLAQRPDGDDREVV